MDNRMVLITGTGLDRPGIIVAITMLIAGAGVRILKRLGFTIAGFFSSSRFFSDPLKPEFGKAMLGAAFYANARLSEPASCQRNQPRPNLSFYLLGPSERRMAEFAG